MSAAANENYNLKKGIAWILFSAFGFACMDLCVRMAGDLPFIQKTLFRNSIAFIISFTTLLTKSHSDKSVIHVEKGAWKWIVIRSAVGSFGIFGNFYALGIMNISDAAMLNKMSPFFAVFFSIFIVGEKPNLFSICSLIAAFTGALFIIKPGLDFSQTFPAIVAFIGGMGAGCAAACIRKLRTFHVNGMVIIAFFSAFSTLIALPFSIIYFEPMSIQQLLWLCGTGVFAAFGQFGLTGAFYNAPAYKISVYDYSNIVFAAILGFIFLDQVPDQWSLIGYIIIIGAAVAVFLRDLKKHQ